MRDKELIGDVIVILIPIVFVVVLLVCVVRCSNTEDKKDWNNGYCECGGHWIYEQSVGHRYRTSFIFKCDKCGKHIEIWELQIAERSEEE